MRHVNIFAMSAWLFVPACVGAQTQAHYVQLIQKAPTITSIQSNQTSALVDTSTELLIQVIAPNGTIHPDGAVVLMNDSSAVGTAILNDGKAAINETVTQTGSVQVTACYQGSARFTSSCSEPLELAVLPPFSLQQTSSRITVFPTTPYTDQLKVLPAIGYKGTLAIRCHDRPGYYQCSANPSVVSMSGDGSPQAISVSFIPYVPWPGSALVLLPALWAARGNLRKRRAFVGQIWFVALSTALMVFAGCGSGIKSAFMPTKPGDYQMSVDASSGNFTESVTYQVTVK